MSEGYIPRPYGEFFSWQQNLLDYASSHLADLGLVAGDLTAVSALRGEWEQAFLDNQAKQAAAEAATQLKHDRRRDFEAAIRALVRKLQASPAVDDSERQALGITVRDTQPTPVGPPTTRPVALVDTSQRLRHEIAFADEGTPTRKAKPSGAMGAEIWRAITAAGAAAPVDPSGYTFIALDTSTPYVLDFAGADAGKTAHYILRWVNTRGQKGPWSETVSATIGG